MSNFAPPLSKLGESGIPNTVAPAAGKGLTLDPKSKLPPGLIPNGDITITQLAVGLIFQLSGGFTAGTQYILKAGRTTANSDGGGNVVVTYPAAFPSATDYVFANSVAAGAQALYRIGAWNASTFTAFFNVAGAAEDFVWLAIGH